MTATLQSQAPEYTFTDVQGEHVRLSDFWSLSPKGIVLVFLRHFGCMFCKDHVSQLRDSYDAFDKRGWNIVAVGQGTPARSAKFRDDNHLPFPVLGDMTLASYDLYGLRRGALSNFLNPGLYKAGMTSFLRGNMPGKPEGDASQDPGTFLIDRSGRLLHSHIGKHSGDFPSASAILRWIDALPTA